VHGSVGERDHTTAGSARAGLGKATAGLAYAEPAGS
jgi:hypothetical protein